MKIVKPDYIIESIIPEDLLQQIEKAGRISYKSEDKISKDSTQKFIKNIIKSGHLSVRFIVDREISHRLASFTQESTRYCNYSKGKFGNELTFILPSWFAEKDLDNINSNQKLGNTEKDIWVTALKDAETSYLDLIAGGWTAQEARSVLPNSLKTEIIVSANLREWRTILQLRTDGAAHPQMREVMLPLLRELQDKIPIIFDDILPIVNDSNTESFGLFEGFVSTTTKGKKEIIGVIDLKGDELSISKDNTDAQAESLYKGVLAKSNIGTAWKIDKIMDNLKTLLLYKNKKYGDAALNPNNIFSKLDSLGSIKVRLDDKLSRIKNATVLKKNDLIDLLGYLVLLSIANDWLSFKEFED